MGASIPSDKIDTNREEYEGTSNKLSDSKSQHVSGNAILVTQDGIVRKLPVPSNDPNDPLNYTKWEKLGIIISCCWFCKF